jgi:hypothetical protein
MDSQALRPLAIESRPNYRDKNGRID